MAKKEFEEPFSTSKDRNVNLRKQDKDPDKVSEDDVVNVPTFASQKLAQHKAFDDGRQLMKKRAAEKKEEDKQK